MTHSVRMIISQVFWSAPCGSGTRCWVDQIQTKQLHLPGEGNKTYRMIVCIFVEIRDMRLERRRPPDCVYFYCLKSMFSFLFICNFLFFQAITLQRWQFACLKQGWIFSPSFSDLRYSPTTWPPLEVPLRYPLSLLPLKLSETNSLSLPKTVHPFVLPSLTNYQIPVI